MRNRNPVLNESSSLLLRRSIEAGITSPRELANILGNASVETANFSTMHERFNYKSSERIIAVVASSAHRFSREQIDQAVKSRDPERVAEILYGGRRDLGNDQRGDGWRFHGRGYFQYTGRFNYSRWGRQFGINLLENPEQAAEPEMAAKLAIAYWKAKVPVEAREDVMVAAECINGGTNGLSARVISAQQWLNVITPQLVSEVSNGRASYPISKLSEEVPRERARHPKNVEKTVEDIRAGQLPTVSDTRALQVRLSKLGYRGLGDDHSLAIDGSFGPNTRHAVESFQRAHGLHVDGVVGKHTLAALESAQRWPLLSEATHPHHALYDQVAQGIHRVPQLHGKKGLDNAAVALTVSADAAGMRRVDHVVLGSDGVNVFAVQGRLDDPAHRRVHVELAHATTHSPEHHLASMAAGHPHVIAAQQQVARHRGPAVLGP